MTRLRSIAWTVLVPLALILLSGVIRFHNLGEPADCYFDETYYYYDAREYLSHGTEQSFAVHPPVGKWLIAGGLAAFGVDEDDPLQRAIEVEDDNCLVEEDDGETANLPVRAREDAEAFARRVASAIFGTVAVGLTYLIGMLLFRRRSAALLAAGLLAIDGLAVTMSRISMLDIFLQTFTLLGLYLVLRDRKEMWDSLDAAPVVSKEIAPQDGGESHHGNSHYNAPDDFEAAWAAPQGDSALGVGPDPSGLGLAVMGEGREAGELRGREADPVDAEFGDVEVAAVAATAGSDDDADLAAVEAGKAVSRRWLWLAGVGFGLAVATKWTGLAGLGLGVIVVTINEFLWVRRAYGRWLHASLVGRAARVILALGVIPVVVYVTSYAGWFANFENTRKAEMCEITETGVDPCRSTIEKAGVVFSGWWEEQGEVYRFHRNLEADHPYRASAWTWFINGRPVAYYYESCPEDGPAPGEDCVVAPGDASEVLGMGNPFIWWMALLAYPWLVITAIRNKSWPALTILLFLFGQMAPYLILATMDLFAAEAAVSRPVFLFYMTPMVPFMTLALAQVSDDASDTLAMRWIPYAVAILATLGFLIWMPVFLGFEIPKEYWNRLMWFSSWV